MNRESFSDPETAKLINQNFIPVLVDRLQQSGLRPALPGRGQYHGP